MCFSYLKVAFELWGRPDAVEQVQKVFAFLGIRSPLDSFFQLIPVVDLGLRCSVREYHNTYNIMRTPMAERFNLREQEMEISCRQVLRQK